MSRSSAPRSRIDPVDALGSVDPIFAGLRDRNGPPPRWRRPATFGTLLRLILEQQVSLASAAAAYERLVVAIGEPEPATVLACSDDEMRRIGFSRQKTRYARELSERMADGSVDFADGASSLNLGALAAVPGFGPWTMACVRIFVVGDPDVWPVGDRALHVSMAKVMALPEPPDTRSAAAFAAAWSPYRSTAARMLWHDYLGGRAYVQDPRAGFLDEPGIVAS